MRFAPIYDCGSCLFSVYTDEKMQECMQNNVKMQDCIKNTSSAIRDNGAKIKYFEFITSLKNEDCNKTLIRMHDKINVDEIAKLIDKIDIISNIRKEFYKKVIEGKYKEILAVAYKKLNKK